MTLLFLINCLTSGRKKDIIASNGRNFCNEAEALWRHGPPGPGLLSPPTSHRVSIIQHPAQRPGPQGYSTFDKLQDSIRKSGR